MNSLENVTQGQRTRALGWSTLAFAACFAVWTIFSIIGISIEQELGLSETQFGLLVATPVLTGSISRILLGVLTEQYGGRLIFPIQMLTTAFATVLLSMADSYGLFLLAALGVGLAGGSFIIGVAYVSRWYEAKNQGTALGVFGAGGIGAAVTNFAAPFLVVAFGWQQTALIYAAMLTVVAVAFWIFTKDDPALVERRRTGAKPVSALMQLQPLRDPRVWRFATYYFFVFGGFVALASWLPRYYIGTYGLELQMAGMLAAAYALPGSVFRAFGGWLSDKFGARAVMYLTFSVSLVVLFVLSYPATHYIIDGIDGPIEFSLATSVPVFVVLTIMLGFVMSLGMAAVYKHIPVYYPHHVGGVGGLVGTIGGLGGFVLPISFGIVNDLTGIWTSCFILMFVLVAVSLTWMHVAIRRQERRKYPALATDKYLSDLPDKPIPAPGVSS